MPRFLDPQSIFPKRLGLMNGNTIVIEYYDLTRDKFKKHPIPYNPQEEVKSIVDQIFKDAKHIPFIKKVDPKHLKAVLEGQPVARREQPKMPEKDRFQEFEEPKHKEKEIAMKEERFQESFNKPSNIISNDSQLSNGKSKPVGKPAKPQQIDDYYAEQFEQFQISQSMDKASKNISISNIQKSKPSLTQSNSSVSQSKPQIKVPPPKVEEEIEEEYADDFQFVDEEPKKEEKKAVKQEKKEKKQKKEKKEKSKSKEKKSKKEKKKAEEKEVEEQFQFL